MYTYNSLLYHVLYGLPNSHIMKLQRIQNAAARLVTGTPRFCHVTPLFFHLHWLPISYRIKFKILLLTFKCLYGQAPNYLIDFITIKKQSRYSLRSNESIFLELPGIKTHPTLGDRAFQSAAPYLWNALPSAIRNIKTLDTFKTAVKTHFFNLGFKQISLLAFIVVFNDSFLRFNLVIFNINLI